MMSKHKVPSSLLLYTALFSIMFILFSFKEKNKYNIFFTGAYDETRVIVVASDSSVLYNESITTNYSAALAGWFDYHGDEYDSIYVNIGEAHKKILLDHKKFFVMISYDSSRMKNERIEYESLDYVFGFD